MFDPTEFAFINRVTVSNVFTNYVPVVPFLPPYTNGKHRTYAENTILIHYKPITFLTITILGIKSLKFKSILISISIYSLCNFLSHFYCHF